MRCLRDPLDSTEQAVSGVIALWLELSSAMLVCGSDTSCGLDVRRG